LPPFAARWCRERARKGQHAESGFPAPNATLDIHDLEAGGFRNCELTIVGPKQTSNSLRGVVQGQKKVSRVHEC